MNYPLTNPTVRDSFIHGFRLGPEGIHVPIPAGGTTEAQAFEPVLLGKENWTQARQVLTGAFYDLDAHVKGILPPGTQRARNEPRKLVFSLTDGPWEVVLQGFAHADGRGSDERIGFGLRQGVGWLAQQRMPPRWIIVSAQDSLGSTRFEERDLTIDHRISDGQSELHAEIRLLRPSLSQHTPSTDGVRTISLDLFLGSESVLRGARAYFGLSEDRSGNNDLALAILGLISASGQYSQDLVDSGLEIETPEGRMKLVRQADGRLTLPDGAHPRERVQKTGRSTFFPVDMHLARLEGTVQVEMIDLKPRGHLVSIESKRRQEPARRTILAALRGQTHIERGEKKMDGLWLTFQPEQGKGETGLFTLRPPLAAFWRHLESIISP